MPNQFTALLPIAERLTRHSAITGQCRLWTGAINPGTGYGVIKLSRTDARRKMRDVHRVAYAEASGAPIPKGMCVCHTCDVRLCIQTEGVGVYEIDGVAHPRFGHLWLGTKADNLRDMALKGRSALGDKNGSRLHPERMRRGDSSPAHLHPERMRRGEEHGIAKLTDAAVLQIRAAYATGLVTQSALALRFDVCLATIQSIVHRRTWRHLP